MRNWIGNNILKMACFVLVWTLVALSPMLFALEDANWLIVYAVCISITIIITWKTTNPPLTLIQFALSLAYIALDKIFWNNNLGSSIYLSFAYSLFATMIVVMFLCRVTWYIVTMMTE